VETSTIGIMALLHGENILDLLVACSVGLIGLAGLFWLVRKQENKTALIVAVLYISIGIILLLLLSQRLTDVLISIWTFPTRWLLILISVENIGRPKDWPWPPTFISAMTVGSLLLNAFFLCYAVDYITRRRQSQEPIEDKKLNSNRA
jgi:hypothetical protein